MLISLLNRYWVHIAITTSAALLVWYIMYLRSNLDSTENKLQTLVAQLSENKIKYDSDLVRYKLQEKEVETKWRTKYETIYVWRDKNASCEDVMSRFDSTVY